ncbi:MAG: hypothetical protein U5L00_11380 [Desulfovermiculus sp.]|nr:hypothetical protein [Desulfovermiculus sp.]
MDAREDILMQVDGAMDYRSQKAAEYPHDERNSKSAAALEGLRKHIENVPSGHSLLVTWSHCWQSIGNEDERTRAIEEINHLFGRYGFDGPEDPEEFCLKVSEVLTSYLPSQPGPSRTQ